MSNAVVLAPRSAPRGTCLVGALIWRWPHPVRMTCPAGWPPNVAPGCRADAGATCAIRGSATSPWRYGDEHFRPPAIWSTILMALDVIIIYALTVRWDDARA